MSWFPSSSTLTLFAGSVLMTVVVVVPIKSQMNPPSAIAIAMSRTNLQRTEKSRQHSHALTALAFGFLEVPSSFSAFGVRHCWVVSPARHGSQTQ